MYNLLTVLGPTAVGKTSLAAHIAYHINGEIISADSRQVYRKMDIGTGKDIEDYLLNDKRIPYHLIDIHDPGYQYNIYEFQKDFLEAYQSIKENNKFPVLCGGSGMYIEAVLKGYKLTQVPVNDDLRKELENRTIEELREILSTYKKLHNKSDTDTKKRAIRAIEIAQHYLNHPKDEKEFPQINNLLVGVKYDRLSRRKRITERLTIRLDSGMIEEVKLLLNEGLTAEQLIYYGLEYKFITRYVIGEISYNEMFEKLNTAIHQFAKRQMTWFRRMEKNGFNIKWLDGYMPLEEKVNTVLKWLKKN